jgi:hypothetical protein
METLYTREMGAQAFFCLNSNFFHPDHSVYNSMNLIVVSHLTTNEGLYFRYLTMVTSMNLGLDVLVESQQQQRDYYFNLLKRKGLYDYVMEIVTPEEREEGIRLDTEMNFPLSVIAEKISVDNVMSLIVQIQNLVSVKKKI